MVREADGRESAAGRVGLGFDTPGGPGASWAVLTHTSVSVLLAQAMVERGLLDSIAAGVSSARYRLELYVGEGNAIWVVIGVVVLLVLTRVKRNR